jgi:hypothetical protein
MRCCPLADFLRPGGVRLPNAAWVLGPVETQRACHDRVDDPASGDIESRSEARIVREGALVAFSASATTYGATAALGARVAVKGAAPGVFATQ